MTSISFNNSDLDTLVCALISYKSSCKRMLDLDGLSPDFYKSHINEIKNIESLLIKLYNHE